jgi:hypothetical protein
MRRRLKPLAKLVLHNDWPSARGRWRALVRRFDAYSVGSMAPLRKRYIREQRLLCGFPSVDSLLRPRARDRQPDAGDFFAKAIPAVAAALGRRLAASFGLRLDWDQVARTWLARLADARLAIASIDTRPFPPRLLLSELGNAKHRILAVATRRSGRDVIGFHHGNNVTNFWERIFGYVESSICSEFVCPSPAIAAFHRKKASMAGLDAHFGVRFTSVRESPYRGLATSLLEQPARPEIRRVMIVGFPLMAQRYVLCPADFFYFQIDVERRIARLLRERGFTVIYKAHPEHAAAAAAMFRGSVDEIEAGPFERVWSGADAIVFGATTSTSFGFALMTNRLVVALDIEGTDWNPDVYPLLERRCRMVPARWDKTSRLTFDADVLLGHLANPGAPDHAYVARFML